MVLLGQEEADWWLAAASAHAKRWAVCFSWTLIGSAVRLLSPGSMKQRSDSPLLLLLLLSFSGLNSAGERQGQPKASAVASAFLFEASA